MGELILRKYGDFSHAEREWYFATNDDRDSAIMSSYPVCLAIHEDVLDGNNVQKIAIRRFVRDHLIGEVVTFHKGMNYSYLERTLDVRKRETVSRRTIQHGYRMFYFETDSDAIRFKLEFSEIVSDVTIRHPKYSNIYEDQIEDARNNPYAGSFGW